MSEQSERATERPQRLENMFNNELVRGVAVSHHDKEFQARLKRGGVRNYDHRVVSVKRDGLSFRIRPDDINAVIKTLEAMRAVIVLEELRTPNCIYCGEQMDSLEDAEAHHAQKHEGRDQLNGGDGFEPHKYEIDPNGTIEQLRRENRDFLPNEVTES